MTGELEKKLSAAATLSELEDIYRPYKQKRRTRATIVAKRTRAFEPLADLILAAAARATTRSQLAARRMRAKKRACPTRKLRVPAGAAISSPKQISDDADDPRQSARARTAARACCDPTPPKEERQRLPRSITDYSRAGSARARDTAFWRSTAANAKNF